MGWMIWICILLVFVRLLAISLRLCCGGWWFDGGGGGGGSASGMIEREYQIIIIIIIITLYPFPPHHDVGKVGR